MKRSRVVIEDDHGEDESGNGEDVEMDAARKEEEKKRYFQGWSRVYILRG